MVRERTGRDRPDSGVHPSAREDFAPARDALRQALEGNESEFRAALTVLRAMHQGGHREAGVFLMGLLAHYGDEWGKRTEIVRALDGFDTTGCADFLFQELRRVKGIKGTRGYLAAILKVLAAMPLETIQRQFLILIDDQSLPRWLKDQMTEILWRASRQGRGSR